MPLETGTRSLLSHSRDPRQGLLGPGSFSSFGQLRWALCLGAQELSDPLPPRTADLERDQVLPNRLHHP